MQRGAEAVMDPLKMAYGVKKPLELKDEKIRGLPGQQMRYYPTDKRGNLDEWGAVIKHQHEVYERENNESKSQYRQGQSAYALDLQRAINEKQMNAKLQKDQINSDGDTLNKSLVMRDERNRQMMEQQIQQKRQYGEEAKMMID